MIVSLLRSWLRDVKRHVDTHGTYRWWSVYSACLAALVYVKAIWPFDVDQLPIYYDLPWLYDLEWGSFDCAVALAVCLGLVGLVRRSWPGRLLSLWAIWMTAPYVPRWSYALKSLRADAIWYGFEVPRQWIAAAADDGTSAATMLWCVYLLAVWLVLRPLLKRAYGYVSALEVWILKRWPVLTRFSRPVM